MKCIEVRRDYNDMRMEQYNKIFFVQHNEELELLFEIYHISINNNKNHDLILKIILIYI